MIPTLFGRWQTRTLLLLTIGLLITLPFVIFFRLTPVLLLLLVLIFGYLWDVVYIALQGFRWDRDWPPVFQLAAGIWEGVFTFVLSVFLAKIFPVFAVPLPIFILQYGLIWLAIWTASQSVMRIVFPNWRYRGGQWLY